MATNSGVPLQDPVLQHIKRHATATQTAAPTYRFLCFVAGCPLNASRPDEVRRHWREGWHDANGGHPTTIAWSYGQVVAIPYSDFVLDIGLTATRAATDLQTFSQALQVRPAYTANAIVSDLTHPARIQGWRQTVDAWRANRVAGTATALLANTTTVTTSNNSNSTVPVVVTREEEEEEEEEGKEEEEEEEKEEEEEEVEEEVDDDNDEHMSREEESSWREVGTARRNRMARESACRLDRSGAPARRWSRRKIQYSSFVGGEIALDGWRPSGA